MREGTAVASRLEGAAPAKGPEVPALGPPAGAGARGVLLGGLVVVVVKLEAVAADAAAVVVKGDVAREEALRDEVAAQPAPEAAAGGVDGRVLEPPRAVTGPVVRLRRRSELDEVRRRELEVGDGLPRVRALRPRLRVRPRGLARGPPEEALEVRRDGAGRDPERRGLAQRRGPALHGRGPQGRLQQLHVIEAVVRRVGRGEAGPRIHG